MVLNAATWRCQRSDPCPVQLGPDADNARLARVSFQQQIKSADAASLRHTEYNRSVPMPLENALDVASRPLREERVGRQIGEAVIGV